MKKIFGISLVLSVSAALYFSYSDNGPVVENKIVQEASIDSTHIVKENSKSKQITAPLKKKEKKKRPTLVNPYASIDNYARNTPAAQSKTIESLANYFSQKSTDEYEKARMIYVWMTKNISYNDAGYNAGTYGDCSAEGVFKSKRSVCEGFSNLYKAIAEKSGLEAKVISGYAKGYGYKVGEKFKRTDHAWNAVKIKGEWKLVDVTWGEGYGDNVNGKLHSVKEFDAYWFCTDPHEFLFKHLPENASDQLIAQPLSKANYEQLQYVNEDLFVMGISAKEVLEKSLKDKKFRVPQAWSTDYHLKIKKAEISNKLSAKTEYYFEFESSEDVDIAFINGDTWAYFTKDNGIYKGTVVPSSGDLKINVRLNGFENTYYGLIQYKVVRGPNELPAGQM